MRNGIKLGFVVMCCGRIKSQVLSNDAVHLHVLLTFPVNSLVDFARCLNTAVCFEFYIPGFDKYLD
jgi:hypothetical protein